jgi:hypothetical protein
MMISEFRSSGTGRIRIYFMILRFDVRQFAVRMFSPSFSTGFRHYRFSTPSFAPLQRRCQLPDSDASKTEDRIQKTGNRSDTKPRRRNPAVGFAGARAKIEASETGSWRLACENKLLPCSK